MKVKLKILSALLLTAFSAATIAQNHKNIEVTIDDTNGSIKKHVIVNGVELDEAGIAKLEADEKVKIIHLDGIDAETITMTELQAMKKSTENIQVSIYRDGGKVNKRVVMNGKELNDDELAKLEASGRLKSFTFDGKEKLEKMIFIKNNNVGNLLNQDLKVFTKTFKLDSKNSVTLGFMTNIKNDGWHVLSIVKGSGAEDAGLKTGDIITSMDGVDLTKSSLINVEKTLDMIKREDGDTVDLEVLRNGSYINFMVEARKNNSADIIISNAHKNNIMMINSDNFNNVTKDISVMISDNEHDFNFNEDNINMVFPDNLGELKIFMAQGYSTSKLLGKNHKLSTLTNGLAEYFYTDGGVLVLKVGIDNAFDLQEGDVIKNIDGTSVKVPKDVIKALLKSENQQDIKMKIVRHKRNKTLKYNK